MLLLYNMYSTSKNANEENSRHVWPVNLAVNARMRGRGENAGYLAGKSIWWFLGWMAMEI